MMDTELGLVYYNYRYYNPQDGRWTRRDPVGIEGGVNLYKFTYNNPSYTFDINGYNFQPITLIMYGYVYLLGNKEPIELHKDGRLYRTLGDTKPIYLYLEADFYYYLDDNEHCLYRISDSLIDIAPIIYVQYFVDPQTILDDGHTVAEHEQGHVDIIKDEWNSFKAKAKRYMKEYPSSEELRKAREKLMALYRQYLDNIVNRNNAYDGYIN